MVKNLPARAVDVGSTTGEGDGNPSSVLAWQTEKPGRLYSPWGHKSQA